MQPCQQRPDALYFPEITSMPKVPVSDLPAVTAPSLTERDYPTVCGTMLLYTGVIQLSPDILDDAETKDVINDAQGPTFI